MGYGDLMGLARNARLGAGHSLADEVDLLHCNVAGVAISAKDRAAHVGLLERGEFTPPTLGVFAADHPSNLENIDDQNILTVGLSFHF